VGFRFDPKRFDPIPRKTMKLSIRFLALGAFCLALAVGCDKSDKGAVTDDPKGKTVPVPNNMAPRGGGRPSPNPPLNPPPALGKKDE
jgi:hypothetical protein